MNVLEIFNEAVEIADAVERAVFLTKACGGDAALRRKAEDLLAAHEDPSCSKESAKAAGELSISPSRRSLFVAASR